jgi:hypothetical protein
MKSYNQFTCKIIHRLMVDPKILTFIMYFIENIKPSTINNCYTV